MIGRRLRSKSIRTLLFLSADGKCTYCGTPLETGWHTDHVLAWSKGGKTILENLTPACKRCNLAKGDKDVELFKKENK